MRTRFTLDSMERLILIGLIVVTSMSGHSMEAQGYSADKAIGPVAQQLPAYLQHAVIEQHLNQPLPLSTSFTDETGQLAPLSEWIGKRPTVMAIVYYKCTMLCPEVLHGLATGLKQTTMLPGEDYNVVTFSIDPTDTPSDAAKEKAVFIDTLGFPVLGLPCANSTKSSGSRVRGPPAPPRPRS